MLINLEDWVAVGVCLGHSKVSSKLVLSEINKSMPKCNTFRPTIIIYIVYIIPSYIRVILEKHIINA